MGNQDTRNKLIQTAKQLLIEGNQIENLTARQISAEAGTNLAMINYCFKSKDELLKIAVDEIMAEEFNQYSKFETDGKFPKEQLKELLYHMSNVVFKYRSLTKLSIPYLLLQEEFTLPLTILPLIRNHFKNEKSETECRIIAFQIIYTMQLIFYRGEDFYKYCGLDIGDEQHVKKYIDFQLDLLLGGKTDEE